MIFKRINKMKKTHDYRADAEGKRTEYTFFDHDLLNHDFFDILTDREKSAFINQCMNHTHGIDSYTYGQLDTAQGRLYWDADYQTYNVINIDGYSHAYRFKKLLGVRFSLYPYNIYGYIDSHVLPTKADTIGTFRINVVNSIYDGYVTE